MNLAMPELAFLRPRNAAGKRISLVLALAVHLGLAALLIYGVRWQTKAPEAVAVELVRAVPQPVAVPPAPPVVEPKPEPRPEPKPEPKPTPHKPDIAIKEKPTEKPKPPVKEPPKPQPKPQPEPQADPMQELLERETRQLEQKRKLDEAAKELQKTKAGQANAARNKAVADYLARIRGKIRGNIVLPPELKGNPEALFELTQLPSGEILAVRLKRSSGIPALDAAIERAILKSSPLPKPEQADLFSRVLELRFRPLDD